MEYAKWEGKHCNNWYGIFENVSLAKDSCKRDVQCKGVMDDDCDDTLNGASLCPVGFDYVDDSSDCVYNKKGVQNSY